MFARFDKSSLAYPLAVCMRMERVITKFIFSYLPCDRIIRTIQLSFSFSQGLALSLVYPLTVRMRAVRGYVSPNKYRDIHTSYGVCICIADVFGSISVLQTEWTGSSPVRYSISKGTVGKNFLSGYYEPQKKEDFCSKKAGLPFPL